MRYINRHYLSIYLSLQSCTARVHKTNHSQQPPESLLLSHVDCFSQREFVGLKVIQDCLYPTVLATITFVMAAVIIIIIIMQDR